MASFGQIRSSSGRTLNLSPQGWINDEGENLNAAPMGNALSQAVSGQQMPQQAPQHGNRLAQLAQGPMPLGDFFDATGTSMKGRVDMNGKDAYMTPDGQVVWQNPDGSIGRTVPVGTQKAMQSAEDRQRKIAGENADLAYRQAQTQSLAQGKQATVPAGYRPTADGNMEPIPGGPADQKAMALSAQKAAGSSDVDSAVASLRDAYDRLEKGGGITSTKNGPIDNMAAAASSSGFGQAFGKALGTDNQSARNDVAMTRPALLAALMKATGMSAKQMDSNAELKLWMTTATDPTLDVEANRRALNAIERKYIGGQKAPEQPAPASPAANGYDSAKEARYQAWKKAQGR